MMIMTREIKFRAWDGKRMWQWEDIKGDSLYEIAEVYPERNEHLMQYTGLKDKDGKEIYEGDVVKTMMHYADDDGNPVDGQETTFAVKWVENKGQQYVGLSLFPCDDIHHLEIIGNIYENPDLLTPKP